MKMRIFWTLLLIVVSITTYTYGVKYWVSGAPPYQVADNPPTNMDIYDTWKDWVRPEGPAKVGLQVGHWKNNEVPEELKNLRENGGSTGGGKAEWEVNYDIAVKTKELLELKGITVEILPATVPEDYWADVFVAIHADGSLDKNVSGFKVATPRRDLTGNADELLRFVEKEYGKSTGIGLNPNVSRNMKGYYAFGWWRYQHAIHPMTTAIILETGYLTSPEDRRVIVKNSDLSAKGLAEGIVNYLKSRDLIS